MLDLRRPLLGYVFQAVRTVDREAHEYDVRVRVGEGSESVVIFLSGGIPQCQLNLKNTSNNMRCDARKPVFGISVQVQHKSVCSHSSLKSKVLISFKVIAQLICAFVFAFVWDQVDIVHGHTEKCKGCFGAGYISWKHCLKT